MMEDLSQPLAEIADRAQDQTRAIMALTNALKQPKAEDKGEAEALAGIADRVQDAARAIDKVAKVLSSGEERSITVNVPEGKPPTVNVAAPSVNVAAPAVSVGGAQVTVHERPATGWRCDITKRDSHGFIESFTLTPL